MKRIKFKAEGQRRFLDLIIERLNAPSLRGLLQFGFNIPYSTLKNYYNESRSLPENLFRDLCDVANVDERELRFEFVEGNLGQIRGGKIGKRRKV
ncbi:MAG: hypothetical protein ABIH79_02210 [archaeon]